jgi:hypothetical protein
MIECKLFYETYGRQKRSVEFFLARSIDGQKAPFDNFWYLPENTLFTVYYLLADPYPKDQALFICKAVNNDISDLIQIRHFRQW